MNAKIGSNSTKIGSNLHIATKLYVVECIWTEVL